jgi:hypothetical protein
MNFRTIVGGFCLLAGGVFLFINSVVLYRGAARFGHDDWDKTLFGAAAALVPWVIAFLPSLVTESWTTSYFGVKRPTLSTIGVIVAWLAFVVYNLTTGAGVIAGARMATVAGTEQGNASTLAVRDQRAALQRDLAGIPQHRPEGTVSAELVAAKLVKAYANSGLCKSPASKDQRETCQTVARLDGELAAAQAASKIKREMADLDGKLATAAPVMASADPTTDLIHDLTGAQRNKIQIWLPASTPIILELGAGLMWHFAFSVLGFSLSNSRPRGEAAPIPHGDAGAAPIAALLMSPEAMERQPAATIAALTAQRTLAEWFFRACMRHAPGGSLAEMDWYGHYTAVCRRSNDEPMAVESFRRVATQYVPSIRSVDGTMHYFEVLPLITEQQT